MLVGINHTKHVAISLPGCIHTASIHYVVARHSINMKLTQNVIFRSISEDVGSYIVGCVFGRDGSMHRTGSEAVHYTCSIPPETGYVDRLFQSIRIPLSLISHFRRPFVVCSLVPRTPAVASAADCG